MVVGFSLHLDGRKFIHSTIFSDHISTDKELLLPPEKSSRRPTAPRGLASCEATKVDKEHLQEDRVEFQKLASRICWACNRVLVRLTSLTGSQLSLKYDNFEIPSRDWIMIFDICTKESKVPAIMPIAAKPFAANGGSLRELRSKKDRTTVHDRSEVHLIYSVGRRRNLSKSFRSYFGTKS